MSWNTLLAGELGLEYLLPRGDLTPVIRELLAVRATPVAESIRLPRLAKKAA